MVDLKCSDEFLLRLKRINSPISNYLLDLQKVDETSKDYVNYIGISREDPQLISYLDKAREKKAEPEKITRIDFASPNTIIRLKRSAFMSYMWRDKTRHTPKEESPSTHDNRFPAAWKEKYNKEYKFKIYNEYYNILRREGAKSWDDFKRIYTAMRNGSYTQVFGHIIDMVPRNYEDTPSELCIASNALKHIAYINPGTVTEIISHYWEPGKRVHATSGKVVKRIIGKNFNELFTEKQLTDFVAQFKFQGCREVGLSGEFLYEEMEGEKIRWGYYRGNTHESNSIGSSCMRYYQCKRFFDIYVKNTEHVSMAALMKDDKVAARSILWYPKGKQSEPKYYDRIYSMNDKAFHALKAFLEGNGYENCYDNPGGTPAVAIKLKYGIKDIKFFPYMDSMHQLNDENILHNNRGKHATKSLLQSTSGGPYKNFQRDLESPDHPNDDLNQCTSCKKYVTDDKIFHAVQGDYRNHDICNSCAVFLQEFDGYVQSKDAIMDDIDNIFIFKPHAITLVDGRKTHSKNAKQISNGRYVSIDTPLEKSAMGRLYTEKEIEKFCFKHEGVWFEFNHDDVVRHKGKYYYYLDQKYIDLITKKKADEPETEQTKKERSDETNQPILSAAVDYCDSTEIIRDFQDAIFQDF